MTEIISGVYRMNLLHDYNVIDEDTIQKVFEISESANEEIFIVEKAKLKYGVIKNFYKDPEAVKDFLKNFPIVLNSVSNSPGIQVYFSQNFNNSLKHIFKYFHNILQQYEFPHDKREVYKLPVWETYLNMYWKSMNATRANMTPHVDEFNYGFNIWITKDIPSGTDFYSYKWKNYKEVYTMNEFRNIDAGKFPMFMNSMCEQFHDNEEIEWDPKQLDENTWQKYHTIEPQYNSVTYYPGCYFHMPSVSQELYKNDFLRVSQVVAYSFTDPQTFQSYNEKYVNHPLFNSIKKEG